MKQPLSLALALLLCLSLFSGCINSAHTVSTQCYTGEEYTLKDGNYTVGTDIPVGIYDVVWISGEGDFYLKGDQPLIMESYTDPQKREKELNDEYNSQFKERRLLENCLDDYQNAICNENDVITINDSVELKLRKKDRSQIKEAPKAKKYLITRGTYEVGKDIPEGIYDIDWISGTGYFRMQYQTIKDSITQMFSNGFIYQMGKKCPLLDDSTSYKNMELKNGRQFNVKCNITLKFTRKSKRRFQIPTINEFEFTPGIYEVGRDLPSGTYDLFWVSGAGIVRNVEENYDNFSLFPKTGVYRFSKDESKEYLNKPLVDGDKFEITRSLRIKFVRK